MLEDQSVSNEKGVSLIEVFLSVTLIAILLTVLTNVLSPINISTQLGNQQLEAQLLLRQELEAVRAVRNQSWAILVPNTFINPYYCPVYNSVNNPPISYAGWVLNNGKCATTSDGYTNWITISIPYRKDNNTLLSTSSTYPQDPNTRTIQASVSWTASGFTFTSNETTYITNWRPF